ncbi:MAG: putative glycosyltransferase EpsE [Bacteroidetes bacterium ADurb.Bin174]|nr:MAG: putative glycosyltransferase EpsE [Bacteroidetes bacterium ADurb.Bin174]
MSKNYTILDETLPDPMVSVAMLTFNHASYIAEAIDSALMQRTTFPIKLVIAEDCSTDNTREIVLAYQKKYPEKIKVILQNHNVGACQNNKDLFANLEGKYIAALEGDDYWTDPLKLQKQVDFLEKNPEYSMCFHKVRFEYKNEPHRRHFSNINQKEITTIQDLAHGNYIYTASCVFRNYLQNIPAWFYQCPVGDYPLHLFNAQYGKIKFFNEVMGIYRVHEGGIWSTKGWEYSLEKWAELLNVMKDKFNDDINQIINNALNFTYSRLARGYCLHNRDFKKVKIYLLKIKNNNPDYLDIVLKNIKFKMNLKYFN